MDHKKELGPISAYFITQSIFKIMIDFKYIYYTIYSLALK